MGTPVTSKEIKQSLRAKTLSRDWAEIIKIFKEHPKFYTTKITKSKDTALHVAATHSADYTLLLLNAMEEKDRVATKKALEAKNKQGDTPLHRAAARNYSSSPTMYKRIVSIAPLLVGDRNNEGETPLFLAALHGQKETFLYLHSVAKNKLPSTMTTWRRKGGETILHCTIQRGYFDLAFTIIHLYKDQYIASSVDEKGITPLHVIASKPSAFESGTLLQWWTKILYCCMVVEQLQIPVESAPQNQSEDWHEVIISEDPEDTKSTTWINKVELPENYHTCHDFFQFLWDLVGSVTSKEAIGRNSQREARYSTSHENSFFPLNYATCFEFIRSSCICIFGLFGIGLMGIKNIKQKHVWCTQIMEELVEQNSEYERRDGSDPFIDQSDEDEQESFLKFTKKAKIYSQQDPVQEEMDKKMTALLTATKNGVIELVKGILERTPVAIHDKTKAEKNILHVAVENRQPHIFMELQRHDLWGNLIEEVDARGNNVLHFAAQASKYKPQKKPGSAMQMLREIKWYQFVQHAVPQHLIFQTNKDGNTPEEIFNDSHQKLVEDSSQWLKRTSESCSAVAGLMAGLSFATSSQVPGGNDQYGEPNLKGKPAFNLFAVTSLATLFFSMTALIMFLAILTSSHQPKDFRRDLPSKLLVGLSSLVASIASTIISFSAAYVFVLREMSSKDLYLIYCATCLPVLFYAVALFPNHLVHLKSILSDVPQPSYEDDG